MTEKIVIRHRTNRELYYLKFLAEQDIKMFDKNKNE
jgi:hypothetical protein